MVRARRAKSVMMSGVYTSAKALLSGRRTARVLVVLLAAAWLWKALEITGRQTRLLRRNLGWGYIVDLTIPLAFTGAVGAFFVLRRVAGRRG